MGRLAAAAGWRGCRGRPSRSAFAHGQDCPDDDQGRSDPGNEEADSRGATELQAERGEKRCGSEHQDQLSLRIAHDPVGKPDLGEEGEERSDEPTLHLSSNQ